MELNIPEGSSFTSEVNVTSEYSATRWGSGTLEVFATPAMVAVMENAASRAVSPFLPEGCETVGTSVEIVHTRATALGDTVTATAQLTEVDGRALTFEVTASDSQGEIGRGIHKRFVVEAAKFIGKLKK